MKQHSRIRYVEILRIPLVVRNDMYCPGSENKTPNESPEIRRVTDKPE